MRANSVPTSWVCRATIELTVSVVAGVLEGWAVSIAAGVSEGTVVAVNTGVSDGGMAVCVGGATWDIKPQATVVKTKVINARNR